MEDILTSNVFGTLQYVPPELGLFKFLAKAKTIKGQCPLADLIGKAESVEYQFWPAWPMCEPDVVLHIEGRDSPSWLVGIEAKYRSGKSSVADEEEKRPNDQLAREWIDLVDAADECGAWPVLVYLTADVICPKAEIEESVHEYQQKCHGRQRPQILWLSWRKLPELFCSASISSPLKAISRMAERMWLIYFQGVSCSPIQLGWGFAGHALAWRFQVSPIQLDWRFAGHALTWTIQVAPIACGWSFRRHPRANL
jgi:hypothetical protein